jgi:hypothetical protein
MIMPKRIPEQDCIEMLNSMGSKKFVRWVDGYTNNRSRAVMRCVIDGCEWVATPFNLIHSSSGCPKCSGNYRYSELERINQINNIKNISFIDWVGVYKNKDSKAVVKCLIDGHEWSASIGSLVNGKKGCPKCGGVYRYTDIERINQINEIENVSFIRWKSFYKNKFSKVVLNCDKNHEWVTTGRDVVTYGRGCPSCSISGFNKSKNGALYLLRSDCGIYVKVGISNKYENRILTLRKSTPFQFSLIELYENSSGDLIFNLERMFHKKYESAGFNGFDGATEWLIFSRELLEEFISLSKLEI